jgi:NADPH-dependent curcumin reductase CurA
VLDKVYGFEELPAALEHMLAGKHFGKIGVDFAK